MYTMLVNSNAQVNNPTRKFPFEAQSILLYMSPESIEYIERGNSINRSIDI